LGRLRNLPLHANRLDDTASRTAFRSYVPLTPPGLAYWDVGRYFGINGPSIEAGNRDGTLVLDALKLGRSLLDRLLSAGYAAGLWARPRRWVPPNRWSIARSDDSERTLAQTKSGRAPPSSSSLGAPMS